MALAPFISRDDLGEYLRRDLSDDDLATIAVNAACQIVRTRTRQALALVEDDTVTYTLFDTERHLLLPELPIVLVDEVRVDDEVELDWHLEENGVLVLPSACRSEMVFAEVDYSHGYEAVPDDLRLVALTVAARIYEQGTARQESTGSSSITFSTAASTDLSSGEKVILDAYRVTKRSGVAAVSESS